MMRYILKALFNNSKDINTDGVRVWEHGDLAIAILQPYDGRTAMTPLVVRNLVFQRVERARGKISGRQIYGVVLQAHPTIRMVTSDVSSPIIQMLRYYVELRLPWGPVPLEDSFCMVCGCDLRANGVVFFEHGLPRCSPYCSQ